MLVFILRRLAQAVIVMLTVAFIAFMLFQYVGDPVTNILGQDATPEQRLQLRADLGLDQPFPVQFVHFVAKAVKGEFGLSLRQGRKVSSLIAERLPATLELSHLDVSHIPLHNQIIPWAMKKNIDVVHRADNRIDWRLVKVN